MKRFGEYLPAIVAVLLAIALATVLKANGKGLVTSALLGGSIAVVSVWLTIFLTYRIIMFITRGAPFKIGDIVRITAGDHAGKEGEVTKLVDGYNAVFLRLNEDGSDSEDLYFDWNQVTRRGITKRRPNDAPNED